MITKTRRQVLIFTKMKHQNPIFTSMRHQIIIFTVMRLVTWTYWKFVLLFTTMSCFHNMCPTIMSCISLHPPPEFKQCNDCILHGIRGQRWKICQMAILIINKSQKQVSKNSRKIPLDNITIINCTKPANYFSRQGTLIIISWNLL